MICWEHSRWVLCYQQVPKTTVEQEPRHTSTCTLSNKNSSDDSSVNKQGLYFIFPPFFLPWPTSSHRVQSSPASKPLRGPGERGKLLHQRCESKSVRGCRSEVKRTNTNFAHAKPQLLHFAKVSALFLRLRVVLWPLSSSIGSPAETRARRGRQGCRHAWLLAAALRSSFPGRDRAGPAGTAIPAEQNTAQAPSCSQSPPTPVTLTKSSPFVSALRFLIA